MCDVAPESKYHSLEGDRFNDAVLNTKAIDCWSQEGRPAMGWYSPGAVQWSQEG